MPNVLNTPEKRQRWNEYNRKYSHKMYKTVCIKLNKDLYAKEIAYLESHPKGASGAIKEMLKEKISGGK